MLSPSRARSTTATPPARCGSPAPSRSRLWHADPDLHGVDAVVLPGGFSYGDYLRCGAIARFAAGDGGRSSRRPRDGLPVLGICNGFQILCEAHLLPGALTRNQHLHFRNRDQALRIERADTAWTHATTSRRPGDRHPGQERRGLLRRRRARRSTSSRPRAGSSPATSSGNPNGSQRDIAGDHQRGRQRRRHHAAPRARGRGAHRPVARRPRLLHLRAQAPGRRCSDQRRRVCDTVERAEPRPPDERAALRRARARRRRVRADPRRSSAAARPSPSWRCTRSCGASTAPTSRARCTCASSARRRRTSDRLLAGIGENAGVIDVSDELAVTFKVESHNHPSFVEPYQGAATGVGGIVRDILAMGARPIAVMDPLRFGARRPPGHRPGAARRGRRHRRLRQLPGPAQHRRRGRLRPVLPGQPAGQRAVRRRAAGRPAAEQGRRRRRQRRRADGRQDRPRRHRRRLACWPARPSTRAPSQRRPQRAGRRPVHREAAHRGVPGALRRRTWSSASRTSAAPA